MNFQGTVTINNSTISNNTAPNSGIFNQDALNLLNTIVDDSCNGGTVNATYSIARSGNCITDGVNNNLVTDPLLAPLADNGGPTQTHALLVGSPAVDAADPMNFPPIDQRGNSRIDGNNDGTIVGDIGAFEAGITFTTTKTADTNDGSCTLADCSLREAINAANASPTDDGIVFATPLFNNLQTITLSAGELTIANNGSLVIKGPGANLLTVSGGALPTLSAKLLGGTSRVFFLNSSATATIDGLTIANGNGMGAFFPGQGGGIRTGSFSSLTLTNSNVINNSGTIGGGIASFGTLNVNNSTIGNNNVSDNSGGIYCFGQLTVTNSTVSNNVATIRAGAIRVLANATIVNSTVSSNSAGIGGGIYNEGSGGNVLTITNVTINNNGGSNRGGGIYNNGSFGGGITNLSNSIVGNNFTGGDCLNEAGGTTNASYSLVEDGSCGVINGVNNNKTGDPMLGGLQNNGGPTFTHAILPNSPAIDAGNNALALDPMGNALLNDQRGINFRIVDGNMDSTSTVDVGAYEFLAPTAAGALISGRVLTSNGRGISRATVHITDQNGNIRTVRTNQFGYYRINNLEVGQVLIVNVFSKQYQFTTQVVTLNDSISNLNFIAQVTDKSNTID